MIVTTKELFKVAYGKFAVGAYNINNMEQTLGLFQGNLDSQAPFIIQISKGARSYADKRMLEAMIKAADEIFPEAIFAVHLDHGDLATALDCIESGFYSSVMIDASSEPLEENIRITRQVVEAAHARGISVEAELGQLGGVEEHVQVDEKNAHLTDPDEAEIFVQGVGLRQPGGRHRHQPRRLQVQPAPRPCTSTWPPRSRSACPASRWSCTAPRRCRRKRWPASTRPAAPSRAPRAWTRTSSPRPCRWA